MAESRFNCLFCLGLGVLLGKQSCERAVTLQMPTPRNSFVNDLL